MRPKSLIRIINWQEPRLPGDHSMKLTKSTNELELSLWSNKNKDTIGFGSNAMISTQIIDSNFLKL